MRRGDVIGDVAEGVAGHGDDVDAGLAEEQVVAAADGAIDQRHPAEPGVVGRRDHLDAEALLQRFHRLDVVVVVVGDEDVAEPPAGLLQRVENGVLLRRVDRGGGPRHRVVDEDAVVVVAGGELADLDHCGRISLVSAAVGARLAPPSTFD